MRTQRALALEQLLEPSRSLIERQLLTRDPLEHIAATRVLDPSSRARRANPAGALYGWMIRELVRLVPEDAPGRRPAIVELLGLADVRVDLTTVDRIIKRAERNEPSGD